MSLEQQDQVAFDAELYARNRALVPREELVPYVGQFVAWSLDGTRIVAAAPDRNELARKLEELAIGELQVVHQVIRATDVQMPGANGSHDASPPLADNWAIAKNRRLISLEDLRRVDGRHVALSFDGTRILADGADYEEVWRNLQRAGIDPQYTLLDYFGPVESSTTSMWDVNNQWE